MKKKFSLLAAVALLATHILPINIVFAAAPADQTNYAIVDFNGASVTEVNDATSATATYTHGSLIVSGTGLYSNGTSIYSPAGSSVTLNVVPDATYTGKILISGTDRGASYVLENLPASSAPIIVDAEFSLAPASSTITYTPANDPVDRLSINGTDYDFASDTIEYQYDGSGTVSVTMETFATLAYITSVSINGTNYPVPTATADVLNLITENGQIIRYTFDNVPKADAYTIATTTTRSDIFGGFSWSYKDIDRTEDNYIGNGYLEVQEVEYGGVKYTGEAAIIAADLPYLRLNRTPADDYGEIMLPTGSKVTLKLIPNAGYQLTSFTVNGGEFEAQEEVGTYSFISESGNFHLGAHFTAVDDAVAAEAEAVESGTITLGDGEIDNGTARLDVKDVDLDEEDVAEFEDAAGDYNVKTYLDISLFQTIYKGTATDTWDEQIRELDNEATITLKLDDSIDGNDIVIVHQKHDGTYEVIPTVYDPATHTITFKTSSFSNYAIATRTIAAPDTGAKTADASNFATESGDIVLAILSTATLWGILAFTIKKGLA